MLISRNASLSEITGITLPRENIGEMKNRGFDMLVGWNDNIGDVQYNVSLNATYARNKILFWMKLRELPHGRFQQDCQ